MTLGDIIRNYRTAHNLSMDKFSDISGISKGYISMLEKNKTARGDEPSPSFEMFKCVAKTVGVEVDDLIRTVEGKISLVPNTEKEQPAGVGELSESEIYLIKLFRKLPEDLQATYPAVLEATLKAQGLL